ncbi:hypothetical protein DXG01_005868 [Tephrocybe rancida]|nr:hypothetical protein DXG01_005868 [Tephrocybe rancida]
MTSTATTLFSPLKIGSVTIRNRVAMSALTRNRAVGTIPNDTMAEYYAQRAAGGAGLISTEGTLVSRQGTEWPFAPGIWDKEQVAGWKKIVDVVHANGAYIYSQLWHVGRVAHPEAPEQKLAGTPVYGPSAIAARGGKFRHIPGLPGYVTPTAVEDPWTIIAEFKQAAINAKEAGFDGVELHGANGYLPHQFLDSTSNKRTDQWGGSIENRARFGLEILKALVEVFGENVALKVNPAGGYNDVGMPLQETLDTYKYYLAEADKLGLAYITLVRYVPLYDVEFDGEKRATIHDVVASYRDVIKNAKVFVNAGVTPEEAAALVEAGTVDGAVIGFNWITHPDLVKRVQHGKPLDNVPDIKHLQWGKDNSELGVGYTDYPAAKQDTAYMSIHLVRKMASLAQVQDAARANAGHNPWITQELLLKIFLVPASTKHDSHSGEMREYHFIRKKCIDGIPYLPHLQVFHTHAAEEFMDDPNSNILEVYRVPLTHKVFQGSLGPTYWALVFA